MIGIDYIAPSDIGRDWRAGATGEQHKRACPCLCCTDRRVDVLFVNAAFDCRKAGVPVALIIPDLGLVPAWVEVHHVAAT